jgi:hypothetical protein
VRAACQALRERAALPSDGAECAMTESKPLVAVVLLEVHGEARKTISYAGARLVT